MSDHRNDDEPLFKIEAAVLSLVLARIAVRGRLRIEEDLRQLEELVGNELPEVRVQLDQLFGFDTAAPSVLPAASDVTPLPARRGPGRPAGRAKAPRPDSPEEKI